MGKLPAPQKEAYSRTPRFVSALWSATERYVRNQGRPRLAWTDQVPKLAYKVAGSFYGLKEAVAVEDIWKSTVELYCKDNVME